MGTDGLTFPGSVPEGVWGISFISTPGKHQTLQKWLLFMALSVLLLLIQTTQECQ